MILGGKGRSRGDGTVTGGMRRDVVAGNELKVARAVVRRGFLGVFCRRRLFLSKETGVGRAREGTSEESGRIEGVRRAAQGATKAAR